MKKLLFALVAVAIVSAVAVAVVLFRRESVSAASIPPTSGSATLRQAFTEKKVLGRDWATKPAALKTVMRAAKPPVRQTKKRRGDESEKDDWQEYTPEEEQLVEEMRTAAEEESVDKLAALAEVASKSANPTVRLDMVEALSGLEDRVLPEVLMFMSDPDEGVRLDANAAFEQAVLNMEEDVDKAHVIAIAMNTLKDEEVIRELGAGLFDIDDKYMREALEIVLAGENDVGRKVAKELAESLD